MNVLTPENFGLTLLEDGETAQDFVDKKINELSASDSRDAFFVGDLGEILIKHLRWVILLPRVEPHFAVKCNSSRPIVEMLAALGAGFDCASKFEVELMLSLGVDPSRIIYSNTQKQMRHLKYAFAHGITMTVFDCEAELDKIASCNKEAKVLLRIAVDDSASLLTMSDKFGATLEACPRLLEHAKELGLDVIGVSFHVGSACTNPEAYTKAIAGAHRVFGMAKKLGYKMTLLDLGGGYPGYDIPDLFVFKEFADVINASLDEYFPADSGVRIVSEPGRYYPTTAYRLATNIIGKRIKEPSSDENDGSKCKVKTRMYYVNDGVHTSFRFTLFPKGYVMPGPHKKNPGESIYPSVIFGQTCDGHDTIVEECELPEAQVGDWMMFYCMGAYSIVTSTNFNGFPKPAIYYVMTRNAWQHFLQICVEGRAAVGEACPDDTSIDCSYAKLVPARRLYEAYAQQTAEKTLAARGSEQLRINKG